jgi:signal transduction histidine kinase
MPQTISLNKKKKLSGESPPGELFSKSSSVETLRQENEVLHQKLIALRSQTLTEQKQSEIEKKRFFSEVEERMEQVRSLASVLVLAEQKERGRISRILQDDLRQLLYSLLIQLEVLNLQFPTRGSLALIKRLNKTIQGIDQAIDLTRTLAIEVDPPRLKLEGLAEALQWLLMYLEEVYNFNIDLSVQANFRLYNENVQALLLQIVHELLLNVISPTNSHQVYINLRQEGGAVMIQIRGTDIGFDLERKRGKQREQVDASLCKIKNWLELLGGRMEIDSAPGQETRMTIIAPIMM